MKLAALTLTFATLAAGSANADSDCDYAPFSLRPYPFRVVELEVRSRSKDFYNTIVGDVLARCPSWNRDYKAVCGTVAIRGAGGRIEGARRFYGMYDGRPNGPKDGTSRFLVVATGAQADDLCVKFVFNANPKDVR